MTLMIVCLLLNGRLLTVIYIIIKNPKRYRCSKIYICSPHDLEVPSSNPGKNNTSDFSIRDPLSLPSCYWYRIHLAMWWNSSVGRCHGFDSRRGVSHIFRIVWIIIPACLIKQPNGTLSRMYVQTYISVK